jgi:anti-sigma factor RsiW
VAAKGQIVSAPITSADLHAYVDGELDAAQARAVEAAIAEDAGLAAQVMAYRADKQRLKSIYGPVVAQSLPPEWEARIRSSVPARSPRWQTFGAIAATLLIVAGAFGLYLSRTTTPPAQGVVAEALAARTEASTPVKVVDMNGNPGNVAGTLRDIVDAKVKVPDLTGMGYHADGIRVYQNAVEILYRDSRQRVFSLYLKRSDGTPRFDQFERDGLRVCIWQDDRISMVMAGNISAAEMQRLASLAYVGLTA